MLQSNRVTTFTTPRYTVEAARVEKTQHVILGSRPTTSAFFHFFLVTSCSFALDAVASLSIRARTQVTAEGGVWCRFFHCRVKVLPTTSSVRHSKEKNAIVGEKCILSGLVVCACVALYVTQRRRMLLLAKSATQAHTTRPESPKSKPPKMNRAATRASGSPSRWKMMFQNVTPPLP